MTEFLAGVVLGVALGAASVAVGGWLLAAARARYASKRQGRDDERVLRAFLALSGKDPEAPVAVHEVREVVADVPGLDEALERLRRRGHIAKHPEGPHWFAITDEGRRAASGPRPWRRRVFGG